MKKQKMYCLNYKFSLINPQLTEFLFKKFHLMICSKIPSEFHNGNSVYDQLVKTNRTMRLVLTSI